jgi:alpha-L-fucosidase
MVKVVSRDGNYLLNIGPKGDGTVPSQSVEILNSFGDWMHIYAVSIYGTTRSPYTDEPKWGVYTKKPGKLYVHIFDWPNDGIIKIPSLTNTINKIYLMNNPAELLDYNCGENITVLIPEEAPNQINSVMVLEVDGIPED